MKLWRDRHPAGVSLIEILITLAILVIGILAVLRIFPQGLGTLSQVGERQEATRLAEATSNRLAAQADRLPAVIFPAGRPMEIDPGSANFGFLRIESGSAEHRPYDFDLPYVDPNAPELVHRLLANDRLVFGERVLVGRRVGDDGGVVVSAARPYHTLFGPIASQVQRDSTTGQPVLDGDGQTQPLHDGEGNRLAELAVLRDFRAVSISELRRTVITTGGADAYRDRAVFAVIDGGRDDFTGAPAADRLLFELDSSPRLFLIRCRNRDELGRLGYVQLAPVVVPAATMPSPTSYYQVALTHPQPPYAPLTDVLPESVEVQQVLHRDDTTTGGLDRFAYRDHGFRRGVLYFSPALAGERLSLQYVVEDWRNLSEELSVETAGDGSLTAPADGTLQLAARELDPAFLPRVVVIATGQTLPVDSAAWAADDSLARQGLIPLEAGVGLDAVAGSRPVRVFFRKLGNWAVAPAIAPLTYLLTSEASGLTATGDVDDYPAQSLLVDAAPGPVEGTDAYTELWFRPSEAGQSVVVSYEVMGATGQERVDGELHVVPTQANRTDSGSGAARHAIVLRRPNLKTVGVAMEPLITQIAGRSLRVRVTYDEDAGGLPTAPVVSTPQPGVEYLSVERLLELSTWMRRGQ